jgi:hypothetical protein
MAGKKTQTVTMQCSCCGKEFKLTNFYNASSEWGFFNGKIPVCKDCIEKIYLSYLRQYRNEGRKNSLQDAIRRVCMGLNVYYNDSIYYKIYRETKTEKEDISLLSAYFQMLQLYQYSKKNYDNTILEDRVNNTVGLSQTGDEKSISEKTIKFFGKGFSNEDYLFLQEQYDDWTARHECNTKSQEEVFKQICFTQLKLTKSEQKGEDTKDLNATFLKQLEAAKLQPKQNKSETTSETQTFGTLIEKWENERPIPEPEEEYKDVDKIALYIDVFFRGHLAKMMGLKNGLSHLYDKYMKKYTVTKPEYDSDEDSEALFDAIFGNSAAMDDD